MRLNQSFLALDTVVLTTDFFLIPSSFSSEAALPMLAAVRFQGSAGRHLLVVLAPGDLRARSVLTRSKEPAAAARRDISSSASSASSASSPPRRRNPPPGLLLLRPGLLLLRPGLPAPPSAAGSSSTLGHLYGGAGNTPPATLKPVTLPRLAPYTARTAPSPRSPPTTTPRRSSATRPAPTPLVGDSVGMVCLGHDTTVPVTLDDMLHHCKAVTRAASRPVVVGDMPFGTYLTPQQAAETACRLSRRAASRRRQAEGGAAVADRVRAIVGNGMAVQGHIGLLPQNVSSVGGYRVQGRLAPDAQRLLDDALALQDAGCFSVVLEMVPDPSPT